MKAIIQVKGQTQVSSSKTRATWLIPAALILLSLIPLVMGGFRLVELARGAEITSANARFFASPSPVVLHIVGAFLFALLGAFQFVPRLRQRGSKWHRLVGRFLVPAGLAVGLSALWMTLFYPRAAGTGDLLFAFRLVFALGMVVSIVLGFVAIRQKNVAGHRAWMIRSYAIGLGAGTQVLTGIVESFLPGGGTGLTHELMMGGAWVINLAVAEWLIRRRPSGRVQVAAVTSHSR